MIDSTKHQGLRSQMISKLKAQGFSNEKVLNAMGKVPRHVFFNSALESHAYELKAFPIGEEQTISNPATVAIQTHYLDVIPNQKVLEIGTGSGYQTAVLCEMKVKVYSIERFKKLFHFAKKNLNKLNYSVEYLTHGDGYLGLPSFALFDRILATAATNNIPKKLLEQLAIGGKLVIPVGEKEQKMNVICRSSSSIFERKETKEGFRFVPFVNDRA